MEKIIQFHPGIKITTNNRHTTSPPYFSAQSDLSDQEESKKSTEDLSPVYKKKSHFSEEKKGDVKAFSFANKSFDTDESEPNSPESPLN